MKTLKALVIGMGLLIVVGLGLVGFGIFRSGHPDVPAGRDTAQAAHSPSPADRVGQFSLELPIPPGTRLEQMQTAGDRIVLRFAGVGGDKLTVIDPLTGRVTGTVAVVVQKP